MFSKLNFQQMKLLCPGRADVFVFVVKEVPA
jgi:hypothetical protein